MPGMAAFAGGAAPQGNAVAASQKPLDDGEIRIHIAV